MAIAAEVAIRAWINALPIVAEGGALSGGAYLREQRSPAYGAYVMLQRQSEGGTSVVAEDDGTVTTARMLHMVYAGTQEAAEIAAAALRAAIEQLNGCPQQCGSTGVRVLVSENRVGPFAIPPPPNTGEIFAYQVNADYLIA